MALKVGLVRKKKLKKCSHARFRISTSSMHGNISQSLAEPVEASFVNERMTNYASLTAAQYSSKGQRGFTLISFK